MLAKSRDRHSSLGHRSIARERGGSLGSSIVAFSIAIAGCIGLPIALTAMLPVTYFRMARYDDRVAARSQTCLLLVIPYRTQTLEKVETIDTTFEAGEMMQLDHRSDLPSSDRTIRAEDHGWLVLGGEGKTMKFPVSPFNLESIKRDAKDFLDHDATQRDQDNFQRFCVANWKGSIFAGVPLTLLTLLFVFCLLSPILALPYRLLRRATRSVSRQVA